MKSESQAADLAARYINSTQKHVFLTGKAGTGKTTFLKEIVKNTHKSAIVAAPTGIAAINAGGVTLHSLFQLPFGSFIPSNQGLQSGDYTEQFHTPSSLMKTVRLNTHKRKMLQELELLIIDEVSMLRADTLDAIDHILKSVRRKRSESFGGVQLLLIGDMMQLPPVVKHAEWEKLHEFYQSQYFFEAKALQTDPPVYLELEKIYRQQDLRFVELLNHLRDNQLTDGDLKLLNTYYSPDLKDEDKHGAVSLCTHNRQADEINRKMLDKLSGKTYTYEAEVKGDFSEHIYPLEYKLELKKGAQVMFVKNDYSGKQRYFNGKIGEIEDCTEDSIIIRFADEEESIEIETYTWENKRYKLNKEIGEIEENQIGTFEHYPIKLAWAITVHKSQGLTFDKAIIDVSRAFAPGQAYVALSRLRSIEGLILTKALPRHMLEPDLALSDFSSRKQKAEELKENIRQEAFRYLKNYLLNAFDFRELVWETKDHADTYDKAENRSSKQKHKEWGESLIQPCEELRETGSKFIKQIQKIMPDEKNCNPEFLSGRVHAAIDYFTPLLRQISKKIYLQLDEVKSTRGMKKYSNELNALIAIFEKRTRTFERADALIKAYQTGEIPQMEPAEKIKQRLKEEKETEKEKKKTGKKEKTGRQPTLEVSRELYLELKDVDKVAETRGLALSTIYGHMAKCVAKGWLPVSDFLEDEKRENIIKAYKAVGSLSLSQVKAVLGDEYSYEDIRFAMADFFSKKE